MTDLIGHQVGNYRTRIVSGSPDRTAQIWAAASGQTIYTYRGHGREVNAVAWSPDGTRVASGSWDNTVQIWQAL
jgi:WD40 repeat protein